MSPRTRRSQTSIWSVTLGPVLQRRVIPALHYALRPNGYLMLGGLEILGLFSDQFTVVDEKSKIYRKKPTATHLATFFASQRYETRKGGGTSVSKPPQSGLIVEKEVDLREASIQANRKRQTPLAEKLMNFGARGVGRLG